MDKQEPKPSSHVCRCKVCNATILYPMMPYTSIDNGHLAFACEACIQSGRAVWTPMS